MEGFVILAVVLLLAMAQLAAYASILRVRRDAWERIGRSKGGLLALVFFSGGLGGIYYWAIIRRELSAS